MSERCSAEHIFAGEMGIKNNGKASSTKSTVSRYSEHITRILHERVLEEFPKTRQAPMSLGPQDRVRVWFDRKTAPGSSPAAQLVEFLRAAHVARHARNEVRPKPLFRVGRSGREVGTMGLILRRDEWPG